MAQGKKSFIIYTDSRGMVNKLSNERAGILFKTIFSYCDDENPICEDEVVDMAFEHFKNILKRDLKKYENIIDRNRQNGKKGGRPQNQNNPVGLLGIENNPKEPKKADNDTVNVTVNVNDIYYKELLVSESWIEVNAKNNRTTTLKVKVYLTKFNNNLIAQGEKKNNKREYQSHFARWLPLEIAKDLKDKQKNPPLL